MVVEEQQQLTHLDEPMNLDNPILIEAQIDESSATPSPPNEIDYAYMFTFFRRRTHLCVPSSMNWLSNKGSDRWRYPIPSYLRGNLHDWHVVQLHLSNYENVRWHWKSKWTYRTIQAKDAHNGCTPVPKGGMYVGFRLELIRANPSMVREFTERLNHFLRRSSRFLYRAIL